MSDIELLKIQPQYTFWMNFIAGKRKGGGGVQQFLVMYSQSKVLGLEVGYEHAKEYF